MKKKIVFICNSVTLAHPVRTTLLANMLDTERYDVVIYRSSDYAPILPATKVPIHSAHAIPTDVFTDRLLNVRPIFDRETIEYHAQEDHNIFAREKPDLVIGDFRLTLQVTARQAHVPYMNLTGAVWDPLFHLRFEPPPAKRLNFLPNFLKSFLMNHVPTVAFADMNKPLNDFRKSNGMPAFNNNPRHLYTDADYNAYCDLPFFFPNIKTDPTRQFIGPILWAANMPGPDISEMRSNKKFTVYINLGSSGNTKILERLCAFLSSDDINLIVATGRGSTPPILINRPNTLVMPYLASDKMAAQADLVICNGGMPTACTALLNNAYCIGMISNLDQIMGMRRIEKLNAGTCFRNQESDIPKIAHMVRSRPTLSPDIQQKIAENYHDFMPDKIFPAWIDRILGNEVQGQV